MTLSIIICTYNRPKKVGELIELLSRQSFRAEQIIVVDSSDEYNHELNSFRYIDYVRSSHKNQPYQRYLGSLKADHKWLLYLDDDMEPTSETALETIVEQVKAHPEVDAFGLRFEDLHQDTGISVMPKSIFQIKSSKATKIFRWITAYPELAAGKFGWNGVRGIQPENGFTEWFSGGAFIAKKSMIFRNFNFGLFRMFEEKMGMGEDVIIAYSIATRGKIRISRDVFFYHNDQRDSTYTPDVYSFNKRLIYSRLFLSIEKARLNGYPRFIAIARYMYYCFWRISGLLVNIVLNPTINRFNALRGFLKGFVKSLGLIGLNLDEQQRYWQSRARYDIDNS